MAFDISSLTGPVTAAVNAWSTNRTNKKNIEFQREINTANTQFGWDMYNQQRKDALADRDYNSPAQLMQRYKEAGLNPNLIYEGGAQPTAIRSSSGSPGNSVAPQIKPVLGPAISEGFATYGAVTQAKAVSQQTDNLKAMQSLILAQTASEITKNERSKFDLDLSRELKDMSVEAAKISVQKQKADLQFTLDDNERKEIALSNDLKKTSQDIIESKMRVISMSVKNSYAPLEKEKLQNEIRNLQQAYNNLKSEQKLKEIETKIKERELELQKRGLSQNDPYYIRQISELWQNLLGLDY